jgi:hypothetical protein
MHCAYHIENFNEKEFFKNMYNQFYRGQYFLPQATIQDQINQGRTGHYFSSQIPGYGQGQVTWQLIGLTPTGMVQMNINGQFTQVHKDDIVGLTYLGPTAPQPPQMGGGQMGGGQMGGGQPGQPPMGGRWYWIPGIGWVYR